MRPVEGRPRLAPASVARHCGRAERGGRAERAPALSPTDCGRGIGRVARIGGATTPIEITYLSASSTLIASAMTSLRGSIRKKPEVGFGVVGT